MAQWLKSLPQSILTRAHANAGQEWPVCNSSLRKQTVATQNQQASQIIHTGKLNVHLSILSSMNIIEGWWRPSP